MKIVPLPPLTDKELSKILHPEKQAPRHLTLASREMAESTLPETPMFKRVGKYFSALVQTVRARIK